VVGVDAVGSYRGWGCPYCGVQVGFGSGEGEPGVSAYGFGSVRYFQFAVWNVFAGCEAEGKEFWGVECADQEIHDSLWSGV
jgi:hypothetical protein